MKKIFKNIGLFSISFLLLILNSFAVKASALALDPVSISSAGSLSGIGVSETGILYQILYNYGYCFDPSAPMVTPDSQSFDYETWAYVFGKDSADQIYEQLNAADQAGTLGDALRAYITNWQNTSSELGVGKKLVLSDSIAGKLNNLSSDINFSYSSGISAPIIISSYNEFIDFISPYFPTNFISLQNSRLQTVYQNYVAGAPICIYSGISQYYVGWNEDANMVVINGYLQNGKFVSFNGSSAGYMIGCANNYPNIPLSSSNMPNNYAINTVMFNPNSLVITTESSSITHAVKLKCDPTIQALKQNGKFQRISSDSVYDSTTDTVSDGKAVIIQSDQAIGKIMNRTAAGDISIGKGLAQEGTFIAHKEQALTETFPDTDAIGKEDAATLARSETSSLSLSESIAIEDDMWLPEGEGSPDFDPSKFLFYIPSGQFSNIMNWLAVQMNTLMNITGFSTCFTVFSTILVCCLLLGVTRIWK